MKELSLDEVKKIQLDILKEVAGFCNSNNIKYFLCAGTMLGAIRHKGFIPWDDDIDIMLPRPDYEKFLKEYKSDKLELFEHRELLGYNKTFAKMSFPGTLAGDSLDKDYKLGVNIDLFPVDGFPKRKNKIKKHIQKIWILRKLLTIRKESILKKHNGIRAVSLSIFKGISLVFPERFLVRKITKLAQKYSFESSKNAGIAVHGYGIREVCPQFVFEDQIEVSFEGYKFKGHKNYDTYLTSLYGDYMTPVKPEDRETYHGIRYFKVASDVGLE